MVAHLLVGLSLALSPPAAKTLREGDNGKTVTIARHQLLNVSLTECCGENSSRWHTTTRADRKVLKRRSQGHGGPRCLEPVDDGVPTCMEGGPEATIFRYEGWSPGVTTLRYGYFEKGKSASSRTFQVTVRVR